MVAAAKLNPAVFFATCARLIPQDVWLSIEQTYGALEPADYAVLRAIREAISDADEQSPAASARVRPRHAAKGPKQAAAVADQRPLRAKWPSCCIAGSAGISVERPENLFFADNRYYPRDLRPFGYRPSGRRSRPKHSQGLRRALYERAHTAQVTPPSRHSSPLSKSAIAKERLSLESAIREIEADTAGKYEMGPRKSKPDLVLPLTAAASMNSERSERARWEIVP